MASLTVPLNAEQTSASSVFGIFYIIASDADTIIKSKGKM